MAQILGGQPREVYFTSAPSSAGQCPTFFGFSLRLALHAYLILVIRYFPCFSFISVFSTGLVNVLFRFKKRILADNHEDSGAILKTLRNTVQKHM